MSIFGVEKKQGIDQAQINKLDNEIREMNIKHRLLFLRVNNISDKKIITISAESKGQMYKSKVFSFGNGGKEVDSGYVMNFRGKILGMGLSSKRNNTDNVSVVVSVNGIKQATYGVNLNNLPRKHDNFDTPLNIEASDVINFVGNNINHGCENTVVSAIIELIF